MIQILEKSQASLWRETWQKFRQDKMAIAGIITLLIIVLSIIFLPLVYKTSINNIDRVYLQVGKILLVLTT